jgi:hypothetical protein
VTTTPLDLGDTSRCPDGPCDGCGNSDHVVVETQQTPVGVHCMRVCRWCADNGLHNIPRSLRDACDRVCAHAVHLGIDLDQMAAAIEAQR